MIVLAGLMGASGIILAAAAAHTAPGAGLDSAAYMLLFHATAVLSGTVLLQQGLLLRPMMLGVLAGWVLGSALFSGDIALRAFLVSFSSVGAGAIGVTALVLLYPRVRTAQIVGSDIAHAVPLTLIAGLGYGVMGSVDLHTLVSLLAGSLPGIFVGSSISARVPDTALRYLLAAVLIVVGSKLLIDVSAQPRANVEAARMTPASESGCAVAWREDRATDAIATAPRYPASKSRPNCSPSPKGD
jgi:uncharacterized membrane protein YfcA